jgi:hypothetical protein
MPDDNNEGERSTGFFKCDTGLLHFKERRVVFWFCIALVIIGIILAITTGNQWWLALSLGPFSIIVTATYAKKGDTK